MKSKSTILATAVTIAFFLCNYSFAFGFGNGTPPEYLFHDFSIYNVEEEIIIEWSSFDDDDVKYFIIERATGKSTFYKEIGRIKALHDDEIIYLFSDENPALHNSYRVKVMMNNGSYQNSEILRASVDESVIGKHIDEDELKSKG